MKINIGKTTVMACRTKSAKKRLNIKIDNGEIGESNEFCYLRRKIKKDSRCNADIRSRIGQAKKTFAKITKLLVSD